MTTLLNDIKYALRQLRKNPCFTIVAILTLALGIGTCTVVFSLIDAVLLRSLPFHEPEHLVWIQNNMSGDSLSHRTSRLDHFLAWRAQAKSFEAMVTYNAFFEKRRYSLTGVGDPQNLRGVQVSQNFLDVLGVQPFLGRNFVEDECIGNGLHAALLSHAFWRQKFDGSEEIIGQSVTLNRQSVRIVGVLPPLAELDVIFSPGTNIELLLPLSLTENTMEENALFSIGRLKPGITVAQAQQELAVIQERLRQVHPERHGHQSVHALLLDDHVRGVFRPAFMLLAGAVLCVLLIACINLSNLLLARDNARRRDASVRMALGASGWHLVRQTMTENLLLASASCLLGVLGVSIIMTPFTRLHAFNIPLLRTAFIDTSSLQVAIVLAGGAALLCSVLPALQLRRREASEVLHDTGDRGSTGKGITWIRRTLVVSEIALACLLLVGAGLLIRSFVAVLQTDLGFKPTNTYAWRVGDTRAYNTRALRIKRVAYYDRLVECVSAIPGVESVGLCDRLPWADIGCTIARAEGVTYKPDAMIAANIRHVDQRYLNTMRIPLLAGRNFTIRDGRGSGNILISETLARHLQLTGNPVGHKVFVGPHHKFTVIGMVADMPHGVEGKPRSDCYISMRQEDDVTNWPNLQMVVRAKQAHPDLIPTIQKIMREFDPALPYNEVTTLNQIVDRAIAPRRLITGILGSFSCFALLLAAIGLYGVIAYSVGRRTQEIGIRRALGAQRNNVLRLVLCEGLHLAIIGVAVGLLTACCATRILQSQLYGVSAGDPLTFIITAIILVTVTLLASYIPARRAAKIDPMEALRYE